MKQMLTDSGVRRKLLSLRNGQALSMQKLRLDQLDERSVAVELRVQGRHTVLRGVARYEPSGEFGPALRMVFAEPSGAFEIILKESEWDGQVESGSQYDCDYAVQLDASCLSAR
jgi:hypothetical protein